MTTNARDRPSRQGDRALAHRQRPGPDPRRREDLLRDHDPGRARRHRQRSEDGSHRRSERLRQLPHSVRARLGRQPNRRRHDDDRCTEEREDPSRHNGTADIDALGKASVDRLRAERLTLSNRLSGVNTQIKRAKDKAHKDRATARKTDLLARRDAVNAEIAKSANPAATCRPRRRPPRRNPGRRGRRPGRGGAYGEVDVGLPPTHGSHWRGPFVVWGGRPTPRATWHPSTEPTRGGTPWKLHDVHGDARSSLTGS